MLLEEASKVGRDGAAIRVCFSTGLTPRERAEAGPERRPFDGTPEQLRADLAAYRAAGVDQFVFGFGPGGPGEIEARLRWFAERVMA
jgi:alkanesulfonate monooxygenase SsuD/methylene tetrahydromethanopterin reductase-like flavin-dependent oxidoreductase (luciferase family)